MSSSLSLNSWFTWRPPSSRWVHSVPDISSHLCRCFSQYVSRIQCRNMSSPDGSWSLFRFAAVGNTNWTQDAGIALPSRTQLFLEILMVLMCLGAVTGSTFFFFFFPFKKNRFASLNFTKNVQVDVRYPKSHRLN